MSDDAGAVAPSASTKKVKSRRGRRILGLLLLLLLVLIFTGSFLLLRLIAPKGTRQDVETGGLTWIRSIYGMSNKAADQLDLTQAAVTAPDGNIWVVDAKHQALMRFTADGRYTGAIKGPADTPLFAPSRFAIGDDGKFYVCETAGDVVRVLSPNGQEAGSFGVPKPVSVAVRGDRIVVGSISGFAILDPKGKPITIVGSRGKGEDQFDYVHGVAIAENGNIYVSDAFNNRISAYDSTGKRLWIKRTGKPANSAEFDQKAGLSVEEAKDQQLKGSDALQLPLGLTIDGAGRVVVVDMFDSSLAVFDPQTGKFLGKYGEIGAEDGQFFYPASVSYDAAKDWFTVADQLNNRVEIVRLPGSATGGEAAAAARRALTGPLRACILPLLLLILVLVALAVARAMRKRRENAIVDEVALPADLTLDDASQTAPSVE
jgi:DNA-binding beta-propeller fold protein YncE